MQHASLEQLGALARASRSRTARSSTYAAFTGLRWESWPDCDVVISACCTGQSTETVAYAPQPFEVLPGELASISVSPTRATAGTDVVLNVSGTLCRGADAQVDARIERAEEEPAVPDEPVARALFTPNSAGSWSAQITIPATTPAGTYIVGTQCLIGDRQFFIYLPPPPIELAAVPARPVPAPPRLTG
jgi:hypothetical protein